MIRRPPRSTQSRSSAASDVYKRQAGIVLGDASVPCDVVRVQVEEAEDLVYQLPDFDLVGYRLQVRVVEQGSGNLVRRNVLAVSPGVTVITVSYTHLRAHATRHDIV